MKGATTTTYTQAHVERLTCEALKAQVERAVPAETISDAVDIYLGKIERDNRCVLDRSRISPKTAAEVVDTVVACIGSRKAGVAR